MTSAVDDIYSIRSQMIVIGLTGRTGSGCTTASELLGAQNVDFPEEWVSTKLIANEEEHRRAVVIMARARGSWKPYTVIRVSDLMLTFLFEGGRETFNNAISVIEKLSGERFGDKSEEIYNSTLMQKIFEQNREFVRKMKSNLTPEAARSAVEYLERMVYGRARELRNEINKHTKGKVVSFLQWLGDDIRRYGSMTKQHPYQQEWLLHGDQKNVFSIAERVLRVVEAYSVLGHNRFVIDAIRNPYEVTYLKEKIPNFYLFSINAPETDRKNRLLFHKKLNIEDVESIDAKESSRSGFDAGSLISQNIPDCLQKSDVFIRNQGSNGCDGLSEFKYYLLKYAILIERPGIITPTNDERIMQVALVAKLNSGCISRQVGAVVVDVHGHIIGMGWNDVPAGQVPCLYRNSFDLIQSKNRGHYSEYENSEGAIIRNVRDYVKSVGDNKGHIPFCFKDMQNLIDNKGNQVYTRSLHAEENAFLQVSKIGGNGCYGGSLYCTASPCELCSKKSYHLGIKKIVYIDPYPGIALRQIINSGTNIPMVEQYIGATISVYQKLYSPFMPFKDEMKAALLTVKPTTLA